MQKILGENADDFVIAMPPSGLKDFYWRIIQKDESLVTIVLRDQAVNILKRLTFYDDYSRLMESPVNEKNEHRYLEEIRADMEYFGRTFTRGNINIGLMEKVLSRWLMRCLLLSMNGIVYRASKAVGIDEYVAFAWRQGLTADEVKE